jgi:hypothetical protein
MESPVGRGALIGGLLGPTVAAAVGALDALLNAVGFQRVLRVLICLTVGFVGGLLGGAVGTKLYLKFDQQLWCLVIGWVLTGVLIGASIGLYDLLRGLASGQSLRAPLKKTLNGIIGGFLGGLIGGLPFGFLINTTNIPRSNLTIGLVILGLCIGLLIGLAQVILKEAWLKVESGFRAGRELLLTKDETTIGRAESCDVGLFGDNSVERLHARILLKNDRYVLADEDTPAGTYVNDRRVDRPTPLTNGDAIRVGRNVLRFGERQKRTR